MIRLGKLWKRKSAAPQQSSTLTFYIENSEYPPPIEEFQLLIPRAIAKSGNLYKYILNSGMVPISASEMRLMERVKSTIIDTYSAKIGNSDPMEHMDEIRESAKLELAKEIPLERATYLAHFVAYDTAGYGAISMLLEDRHNIEEIEINSSKLPISIYHVKYGRCATNLRFRGEAEFKQMINKFIYSSGKELNEDTPIIDAQLDDARIHAQIRPYAVYGPAASIRIGGRKELNISMLLGNGTASSDMLSYLWLAIETNMNIIIAGAPASGKTTLLAALLSFVPRYKRVITVEEDINELKLYPNVTNFVSLYGSRYYNMVKTNEQVINALRMRPDRLIVGEVRAAETKELFAGANIGVPFMTTLHSNDGGIAILKRLMVKPMEVDAQALSTLDLAVYLRQPEVIKRSVSGISEYKWLSRAETLVGQEKIGDDSVEVLQVAENGALNPHTLKDSKVIAAYSKHCSISKTDAIREWQKRSRYLENLCKGTKDTLTLLEKLQEYGGFH